MVKSALSDALDDQARNAFFFHYVHHGLRTYNYLETFYSAGSPDKHLTASVDSVSLAFFAHRANSPGALKQAKRKYVHALGLIQTAIQNPGTAIQDTTLLAAMLLDLFEKMTNDNPRSNGAWFNHVHGAFQLIKLRGPDQFQRALSVRLLARLCTSLLISCVASYRPIPDELNLLRTSLAHHIDNFQPKWRVMNIMVHFVSLRQESQDASISVEDIIDRATSVDKLFSDLAADMPPTWRYENVGTSEKTKHVYRNHFYIDGDRHKTQTWNVIRLTRILINEIIVSRASSVLRDSESLKKTANEVIENMSLDICASVPQYTMRSMLVSPRRPQPTLRVSLPSIHDHKALRDDPFESWECYSLIFPLYAAAKALSSTSPMRAWIIGQLRLIGFDFGIQKAESAARILEEGQDIDVWSLYAMLGGYALVA